MLAQAIILALGRYRLEYQEFKVTFIWVLLSSDMPSQLRLAIGESNPLFPLQCKEEANVKSDTLLHAACSLSILLMNSLVC